MIDLHVHSTMSDGTFTPKELCKLAKDKKLEAFALTDHDTICGNSEIYKVVKEFDVKFINGIELSLNYNNHQIHVVALGFDENNSIFKHFYHDLRTKKQASIVSVIEYLHKQGLDISVDKVAPYVKGDGMDKYAILRYLVHNKSATGDVQFLWDRYIDPAFRDLNLKIVENPTAEYALDVMKKIGAVTSLAHFHKKIGFLGYTRQEQEEHIAHLHKIGLSGMEAYYPNYSKEDILFADYMIKKYDLLPTGGTDFHGKNRPSVQLGSGTNNNMNIPYSFYKDICLKLNRNE